MSGRPTVLLLAADGARYADALRGAGFEPRAVPPISFEAVDDAAAREALRDPARWAGLVLTSPRALEALPAEAFAAWTGTAWAVGPETAAAARRRGLAVLGEAAGTAEVLAALIAEAQPAPARPFLFLCGDRRRDTLPDALRAAGHALRECVVYRTHLAAGPLNPFGAAPRWAAFFSPSGVEAAREDPAFPWGAHLAALGPTTAGALRADGRAVAAVADEPTPAGLVRALTAVSHSDA